MSNGKNELPGIMEVAIGVQKGEWPHTMDAQVWARHWLETVAKKPEIATDEATMSGWFANAIMAGYDTATMRITGAETPGAQTHYGTEPNPR